MSRPAVVMTGIGASPGIALGYVHVFDRGKVSVPRRRIPEEEADAEVARFDEALANCREQLGEIRRKFSEEQGREHLYVVEAQQLMLDDPSLTDGTRDIIREQRINAEWALQKAMERFKAMFDRIDDEYFRDRRSDLEYAEERLLRSLVGRRDQEFVSLQQKTIIAAHELHPVDIIKVNRENVPGFLTDAGGRTSHIVIIARSLGIPMVVGLGEVTQQVQNGDRIVLDGEKGTVVVNPDSRTWAEYQERKRRFLAEREELLKNRHHRAETRDQYVVRLMANIDFLEELPSVNANGAEGIGILRTEHLFLGGSIPVSEEDQFQGYRTAIEFMKPRETVIRLLDVAGDSLFTPPSGVPAVRNVALGMRGIRLLLKEKDLFRTQVRAILKASAFGRAAILYPMVSGVEEVRRANAWVQEIMEDLSREGVPFDRDVRIGTMVEIPSAALTADTLAQEVDFLSIGTNDLLQYVVAVDRTNELVADLYEPLNKALLQLLRGVVRMGHKAGIEVGVCGEIAGEPRLIPVLLAMEFNFLSMNPGAIPVAKKVIRDLEFSEAKEKLDEMMALDTPERMREVLLQWYAKRLPNLSA